MPERNAYHDVPEFNPSNALEVTAQHLSTPFVPIEIITFQLAQGFRRLFRDRL